MAQQTILVVDSEEDVHESVVQHLKPITERCLNVSNGQDAWELLRSQEGNEVELVVCDMTGQSVGGIELIQRVRASGLETPFIFLTSRRENANAIASLGINQCFVMEKTEGQRRLAEVVKKALSGQKATGSLLSRTR